MHFIQEENLQFSVIRDEKKSLRKGLGLFSVPAWSLLKPTQEVGGAKTFQVMAKGHGGPIEAIEKEISKLFAELKTTGGKK